MERDPVCGMNVEPAKAAATVEFEGKKYFFCAKSCATKFEQKPNKYLSGKMPEGMREIGRGHGGGLVSIGGAHAADAGPIEKGGERIADAAKSPPEKAASTISTTAAQGAIRYTCPMHPEVVQIGPGSCSKCGMALEPMDVVAEVGPDPELVSMRLRFWVSGALSLPVLLLGMFGEHLKLGISLVAM